MIARTENRVSVRWKDIAPTMRSATVAIEDKRYWQHGALDWHGIARAAINNVRAGGHHARAARRSRSSSRRTSICSARPAAARSAARSTRPGSPSQLQDKYTKAEILTAYLNTVFYGESAYGVEAAAHTFFDKTAKQLTLPQSALLAGLPQAPSGYNPFIHPAAALKRRDEVLRRDARAALDQRRRLREGAQHAARAQARQLRHAVVVAVRVRPGAPGAERPAARQARRARRPARLLDGRPAAAVRGAARDQGRAQDAGRSVGRARRDQRAQRQRAGARHLGLRLGQEPVQPGDGRAPLAGLDVQALRAGRRAPPRRRPDARLLPVGLRLVPRGRPGVPAGGRLVAAQRRRRRRRLHEPRVRHGALGQRRLRAAHARSRPQAGRGDRAPARDPLAAARCTARWCSARTT